MLRKIKLHGLAAEKFAPEYKLDVANVGEATRALTLQLKGFREFVQENNFQIIAANDNGKLNLTLGEDQIHFNLPDDATIHIIPVLQGAKSGGLGKILAGVVLLAAAFFIPMALGVAMSTTIIGGLTYGNLALFGLGLIASGVSQMLTSSEKPKDQKKDDSFTISGSYNVTQQGTGVPLIYGRCLAGSVVISAGIDTISIGTSDGSSGGK